MSEKKSGYDFFRSMIFFSPDTEGKIKDLFEVIVEEVYKGHNEIILKYNEQCYRDEEFNLETILLNIGTILYMDGDGENVMAVIRDSDIDMDRKTITLTVSPDFVEEREKIYRTIRKENYTF